MLLRVFTFLNKTAISERILSILGDYLRINTMKVILDIRLWQFII